MQYLVHTVGRCLGAVAGAANAVAWAFTMWVPAAGLSWSGMSLVVGFLMSVFAIVAAIASWRGHGAILFAMFLASFLPIGAVLLRVDHWLRWVGVLDLLLLAAAALIRWGSGARQAG